MEGHWWRGRVIDFLELAGRNGIILNPEKFQFCQDTVEFAGFRISNVKVEPLPKYLDAIRQFPTPKSIQMKCKRHIADKYSNFNRRSYIR